MQVTSGWWASFRKCHLQLTVCSASQLAYARAITEDPEVINPYYDLLEETLVKNDLMDKPTQIFNCDESGFPLDHKPGKVIGLKGQKSLNLTTSGDKAQVTVLACANASGYVMPPMVIYDRKRLRPELYQGEISGNSYGLSEKGWIDGEIFEEWFEDHFLKFAPAQRPLLLLDGHSSHYQPAVVRKAAASGVILFCLPPHVTHLAQPLDMTVFSPLKRAWHEECQLYMINNPGKVVTRFSFMSLFFESMA